MDHLVADCEVLWVFYRGLSDKGLLDDHNGAAWSETNPIGNWLGVTVTNQRVEELQLDEAGLRGPLVPELGLG